VIGDRGEAECDLVCCGRKMTVVDNAGPDALTQFAKEADPEAWKKYAEDKTVQAHRPGSFPPLPQRNGRSATRLDLSEQKPA
jgi:hypothetical protein